MNSDKRQFAPAVERNKEPIVEALTPRLPKNGTILEIASGTGEHTVFFAENLPHLKWQPTNFEQHHLESTEAWRVHSGRQNIAKTLFLDATSETWPVEGQNDFSGIFNANMIHISPWAVCEGLFAGAARVLDIGGKIFLYGPFKIDGEHTAPSNAEFEIWLKNKSEDFGVRDIEDVANVADKNGFKLEETIDMPSNNFIQVFSTQ